MDKKIIQWDAYKFIDTYIDEADWRSSFLFVNERKTLVADLEEKVFKGKSILFEVQKNGKFSKVHCENAEQFVLFVIENLNADFIMKDAGNGIYRIDMMTAALEECVIFANPIKKENR